MHSALALVCALAPAALGKAPEVVVQAAPAQGFANSNALSVTPDGALLAVGGRVVRLFEPASGLLVRSFPLTDERGLARHGFEARDVALNASGTLLAARVDSADGSESSKNGLCVWDTSTGEVLKRLSIDTQQIRFTPAGRLAALVPSFVNGVNTPGAVEIDLRTGKKSPLPGLQGDEMPLADEPSGRIWVTGNKTGLTLVDPKAKKRLRALPLLPYDWFAFNPDFSRYVVAHDDTEGAVVRDTQTGAEVQKLALPVGHLRAIGFADQGARILIVHEPEVRTSSTVAYPDEYLESFSATTGASSSRLKLEARAHSDVNRLVADGRVLVANTQAQLRFFDTSTGLQIAGEASTVRELHALSWSADGSRLFAAEGNRSDGFNTQLWDLSAGRLARRLSAPNAIFAPDDTALVLGDAPHLAHARTFARLKDLPVREPNRAVFSGDGKLVALSDDGKVHILDAATLAVKAVLPGTGPVFSAGGTLLALQDVKLRVLRLFDGRTLAPLRECTDSRQWPWDSLAASPDGALLAVGGSKRWLRDSEGTLDLYETATCKLVRSLPVGHYSVLGLAFSSDGKQLASTGVRTRIWEVRSGREIAHLEQSAPTLAVAFRPGHPGELATSGEAGEIALWRIGEPQPYARLFGLGSADYLVLLRDHRYAASRGALPSVAFRVGTRALPFEQFDLRFNRPDAVLSQLGSATPQRVQAARGTVEKRLKRMGFTEQQLEGELQLPEVFLAGLFPPSTKDRELVLPVRASSQSANLDRLLITVNDVPLAGSAGLDLRAKSAREVSEKITLRLSAGKNRVQVSVLDARGVESLRRRFETILEAPAKKRDLYLVVVGVSAYRDAERSLRYAAKDAADLAAFFEKKRAAFGEVKVLRLLDADAVKEKIQAARQFFSPSTVDDEAVVFFAGHGLRDEKLDYYFATADIDFEHPAARGLPYEEIEALVVDIGARRKLLLIDTCNSGELDKDEATLVAADTKVSGGVIKSRGIKAVQTKAPALGLEGSAELLEDIFADLRRGSGAVAIASAGGAEFALESDAWKNGVFTYALLSTMGAGKSRVSEVRDEVTAKVTELTAGKQRPTVRRENLSDDFAIY